LRATRIPESVTGAAWAAGFARYSSSATVGRFFGHGAIGLRATLSQLCCDWQRGPSTPSVTSVHVGSVRQARLSGHSGGLDAHAVATVASRARTECGQRARMFIRPCKASSRRRRRGPARRMIRSMRLGTCRRREGFWCLPAARSTSRSHRRGTRTARPGLLAHEGARSPRGEALHRPATSATSIAGALSCTAGRAAVARPPSRLARPRSCGRPPRRSNPSPTSRKAEESSEDRGSPRVRRWPGHAARAAR